jgi:hypothetical protein
MNADEGKGALSTSIFWPVIIPESEAPFENDEGKAPDTPVAGNETDDADAAGGGT